MAFFVFPPRMCKAMRIVKSQINKKNYNLKDGIPPMECIESEKDIGVVIDNKLTFNQHISEKINKTNLIMGVLCRTIEYMDCTTFTLLYTALVKPRLEYANQVWCPYLKKTIKSIENVKEELVNK